MAPGSAVPHAAARVPTTGDVMYFSTRAPLVRIMGHLQRATTLPSTTVERIIVGLELELTDTCLYATSSGQRHTLAEAMHLAAPGLGMNIIGLS
ncbi:hypothetical protein RI054_13g65930 [Pseudoscourfieldia marina]